MAPDPLDWSRCAPTPPERWHPAIEAQVNGALSGFFGLQASARFCNVLLNTRFEVKEPCS